MDIYFISGLGADSRVFSRLQLPEGYRPVYIDWLTPLKGESLEAYAHRMAGVIDSSRPFVLAGMSFGGMLAAEICRIKPPHLTVLFSSTPTRKGLPFVFRFAWATGIFRLIRFPFFYIHNPLSYWIFGANTREEKKLLCSIFRDTDHRFFRWAVKAIMHWKTSQPCEGVVQIHGSRDLLIPPPKSKNARLIKGAGHFMVFSHAAEVSRVLHTLLPPENSMLKNGKA